MSLINIFIIVDTDSLNGQGGEITNPKNVIFMYDDQSIDYYEDSETQGRSELGTLAYPGDLLVWFIAPKRQDLDKHPTFKEIKDTSGQSFPLFNNGTHIAPIVFLAGSKCTAAISDDVELSDDEKKYSYEVHFNFNGMTYWWDPFVESRREINK